MNEPAGERDAVRSDAGVALEERATTGDAEARLGGSNRDVEATPASLLTEANERLVLAALEAQAIAENARNELRALARTSQHDVLTGAPNRALMLDRLHHAISMARRRGTRFAVLFVDLDRFKEVNDTFGHAAGDGVLKLTARRLKDSVRDSDTVSRHGGDEFLVLLTEVSSASDAALIAAKMRSALASPSQVGDAMMSLSASVGIAVYPEDGEDADTLIRAADADMYRAKQNAYSSAGYPHKEEGTSAAEALEAPQQSMPYPSDPAGEHTHHFRELREANEELVLAALSAQASQAAAETSLRRQIKILATLAHELRSPLAPILTAAALLKRIRIQEPVLPRLQGMIERQAIHMARLVDDLLDGSRASTGKFSLSRSSVEIGPILEQAVEACGSGMDLRGQQLTMQPLPDAPAIYGDSARLVQVFVNLLHNASKYSPVGGEITISVALAAEAMTITVADNGIGIAAESLPHIFDLFVQDSTGNGVSNDGLGIGLAVVRELVEAHGGTVTASSAGKTLGSQFVVALPIMDTSVGMETPAVGVG